MKKALDNQSGKDIQDFPSEAVELIESTPTLVKFIANAIGFIANAPDRTRSVPPRPSC
jgi:hypothetical protein